MNEGTIPSQFAKLSSITTMYLTTNYPVMKATNAYFSNFMAILKENISLHT